MNENDTFAELLNKGTYFMSLSTIIGNSFSFLEQHSTGSMIVISIATYLTSLTFQVLNYRMRMVESKIAEYSEAKLASEEELKNKQK